MLSYPRWILMSNYHMLIHDIPLNSCSSQHTQYTHIYGICQVSFWELSGVNWQSIITTPQLCNPWCIVGDIWGTLNSSRVPGCISLGKLYDGGKYWRYRGNTNPPNSMFFRTFFQYGDSWVFMDIHGWNHPHLPHSPKNRICSFLL